MKPFIHLFQVGRRCFCYDVNKTRILEIPDYVYRYLSTDGGGAEEIRDAETYVQELEAKGFLNCSRPQISEHPVTEYGTGFQLCAIYKCRFL